jgi:circadian clock protein KaiC
VGVTVLLVNEVEGIANALRVTDAGFTYLGDNVIVLRYMEARVNGRAEVRKAIGVLKKRLTDFDKTMRELQITRYGLKVSEPLAGLTGLLGAELRSDGEAGRHP